MKKLFILFSLFFLNKAGAQPGKDTLSDKFVLVIHGGAGTITRETMSPEREIAYHAKLREALDSGYAVLENRR